MDDEPRSRSKKINAMKARQNFGQLLEEVYYRGEQFVIERAGKPMAAVVPLSVLEQWQKDSSAAQIKQDTKKHSKRSKK